ncbi:MAG: M14 family zinc carboxypeptidase [Planctomycetota bacterium]
MQKSIAFVLSLAASLAGQVPTPGPDDPGTSFHFRVPAPVAPGLRLALERVFGCDCATHAAGADLDVIVMPDELEAFRRLAPAGVTLVGRGRPYRDIAAAGPSVPDANYFTTAEILTEVTTLATTYPTLARVVDLTTLPGAARTHNGNSVWALKVSDNVASDEPEPAIVLAAQHHARELNSPYIVIGAMRRILQTYASDPAIRQVVDDHELWFVPCINPDGVDHVWNVDNNWRKNRRNSGANFGVDNNRNYPVMWSSACGGSTSTSSETYRGPAPLSEPENQTLMALHRAVRPMIYLDFHSSGQEVLFPYSTCATVSSTVRTFLQRYVDDLRGPMAYGTRPPSAAGEAPEAQWVESGTLSFLTEIMTSFQPPFSSTQTEESTRVWPGVRRALTTWRPALRGRVRAVSGDPLETTITFTPSVFNMGEKTVSRARDGVYGLWLPLGTHQVTFTVSGYRPFTTSVTVSAYDQPQDLDVCLIPTWVDPTLAKAGSDRLGTVTSLTYTSPGDGGDAYFVAIALGTSPGIPLGCDRTVPLNGDPLFLASLQPGSPIANGIGVLPGSGQIVAQLFIPAIPALAGLTVHAGGVTMGDPFPFRVKKFSPSVAITFLP